MTAMLLAGALATLAGGRLADRFGRRAVLVGFLLPLAPLLVFFLRVPGPPVSRASSSSEAAPWARTAWPS